MNYQYLLEHKNLFTFIIIFVFLLITYFSIGRWIKKSHFQIDHKRRLLSNTRGALYFIFALSALLIWSNEIYSVIISVAALAAGIAIATKELLLCFAGSFYKTMARPFTVGDRIEIDGIRGDVVEFGMIATQVLEVGPNDLTHQYTGRLISIPNSRFIITEVINETYSSDYVLHVFQVPVILDNTWQKHQTQMLQAAKEVCDEYVLKATEHFQKLAHRKQLEMPLIEPRVNFKITAPQTLNLIVRVTIPSRWRGRLEQEIIKRYLSLMY